MKQNISIIGLIFSLLILSGAYYGSSSYRPVDDRVHFADVSTFPMEFPSWKGRKSEDLGSMEISILRLDSWLKRSYTKEGGIPLSFYLGYWKRQSGEYQAAKHSPLLCLPSNGWTIRKVETRNVPIPETGSIAKVSRLVGELRNQTFVVYFWFFAGEDVYTSDFQAILRSGLGTVFTGRSDGGILEITVPVQAAKGNIEAGIIEAEEHAEHFIREMYPSFLAMVKGVSKS